MRVARVEAVGDGAAGLLEHDAVHERTLEITFLEPGAEAHVFTFG